MSDEMERLGKFADKMFELADWPDGGDIDMFAFQDAAVECGLLVPEQRFAPCSEDNCTCAGYYTEDEFKAGITCYRRAPRDDQKRGE